MKVGDSVRTCLWLGSNGHKAAHFYVSLIGDSFLETDVDPGSPTSPLVVEFTLRGAPFMILNGGPTYKLSPAASIFVKTADQEESDRLWASLTANGGQESRCGWLVDPFGVSWQIVPEALPRFLGAPDRAASARAMRAMMGMKKIDIAGLEAAFNGSGSPG